MDYGMGVRGQANIAMQPAQEQPVRLSQVQEQMERSAVITENLQQELAQLFERLKPILRGGDNPSEQKQAGQNAPAPILVGHAMSLSNHNNKLEDLARAVAMMVDRIEL